MDSFEAKFIFGTRIDGCEMDYYKLCTIINFFWGSPMFIFNNRKRKEESTHSEGNNITSGIA